MLEGLAATLLNRFLGQYVKGLDPKQLSVGIWSGSVRLTNLELRREALDQLKLPINVVEGHLGLLILEIPLSNLRGKPVKINIEDVFLLAAPKEDAEYDEAEEKQRAQSLKMEKLERAELLKERSAENLSQEEQQKNQSFMESLTTAVIDNLQVTIKNIHIRYEDSIAAPGHPFALGLTLKEFSAVSTDGDWKPTFIQSSSATTHKLATLGSLSFYWNTDAELMGTGRGSMVGAEAQQLDHESMKTKFREAIEKGDNHQYMLKPVSGRAGVEIDKTGKIEKPKMKARLLFNELAFVLDEDQYRDALMMVDLFHYVTRHQEYKKSQPKATPKEDPRAWLKFAGDAVLEQIHDRNKRWTWDYMKERKQDRDRYIELFKKKKKEQSLNADEQKSLTSLDEKTTYEDLRFWRSLARSQLRKENVGVKKEEKPQTWSSWIWGGGKKSDENETHTEMSEEEQKELYKAIDWDEKKAISEAVDVPPESIKLQVESSLRTGSFTLKRDPQGDAHEVLNLVFDQFQAKALTRPKSMLADISLGGLRVYDGTTEGSIFPQIVKVKDKKTVPKKLSGDGEEEIDPERLNEEATEEENQSDKLFHFVFEQNPLDGHADSTVNMKLKSIEVIYNPRFVVEIAKFFKPPERHMESIGALLETAGATVEGLRQQTRAGLEFALQEHKTIDAQLDIQAPLIIVPESVTKKSTLCLIIDSGHIALNSDLVDKDTIANIQSKQKTKYSEEDFRQLEGLMYDKFLLKLDSTQLLIGPGIEVTRDQLEGKDDSKNYHIVDRINMDFTLETSIIPKASDLTKTRISGHLPVLHASISDAKYKNLMKLIDVAIPKFDSDEPLDGKTRAPTGKPAAKKSEKDARQRSKSFQLEKPRQEIVLDEDHDEKPTPSKEASKSDEESISIHQRNFQFKFTVDKLKGSLFRADPNDKKPDELLVELIAEHFELDFYQRPYDMVAEVLLKSLSVEDYIESDPSPEFKKIISSQDVDKADGKDLFNVRFVKVQPSSPEFQSTYEGIATNLDVSVSTLNFIVTRRTLLTLLDFVLNTFTSPDNGSPQDKAVASEKQVSKDTKGAKDPAPAEDKIRIKVDLTSIALVLNNDGIRLASLRLNTADVGVYLAGGCMRVDARLGSLSLLDDVNVGAAEDSPYRQLVAIEGDELADFRYQTYDAKARSYPGYDALVYLRSGSIRVNFSEEPIRKILDFLIKFGKMQAIFNAARQAAANQANQIQERASKMHFDVVAKTPIISFPRVTVEGRKPDMVTAYLGEIYASNRFATIRASKSGVVANKISAGMRSIHLTSVIHYEDGSSEELEMIDKVDLSFKVKYVEHEEGLQRPDIEIDAHMSPVNLRVSQTQLKYVMELSQTVPGAFATDPDGSQEEVVIELPRSTTDPARQVADLSTSKKEETQAVSYQGPELGQKPEVWTKLDVSFKSDTIGLELILAKDDRPVGDLGKASLSKFSINDTDVKLKMLSDNGLEAELMIQSFAVSDSRDTEGNKFRKIMSLVNDDVKQQFMANISMTGGEDKHTIATATIDSPRVILAIDYLIALGAFASSAFAKPDNSNEAEVVEVEDTDAEDEISVLSSRTSPAPSAKPSTNGSSGMTMAFRVNIEDAQVILIANPTISNSEAIVLGTKQVLLSRQNASTLQVSKVGMFLCRMDKFETSRLRILDDFSLLVSMDNRSQGKNTTLTSIEVVIDPLVLRLSLRDILLALQIVNKVSEMNNGGPNKKMQDDEPQKLKDVKSTGSPSAKLKSSTKRPASSMARRTHKSSVSKPPEKKPFKSSATIKREEMNTAIHGIRVILIGDLHELPLIDWSVKKFDVEVRDWSGAMTGDTSFDAYINVFNFSKSAWEPLIEPWQLGLHLAKEQSPERLEIELYSHKMMELTVTSATIALASKSAQFLSSEEDVLSKPRGTDAPYRIRNYTGFELDVWAANQEADEGSAAKMQDGEEIPWRFENATAMRENLSPSGKSGVVGAKLEGSGFQTIERIQVNREGETLYNLKPKKDVQHRLVVEVKLAADNVKYITFRSPLLVENASQIPIEIGVYDPDQGDLLKIEKILPGEGRPAPVGAAYKHSLLLRPDQGFGYAWSGERLFWKDLQKRPVRTVTCKGEGGDQAPPFHFQLSANFNKNDPINKVYPYMHIKVSAPIEVQNLLPFDFKYRIYDKNTKKDWTNFLRRGGVSPVHVVELSHLLLLSVELQDTVFKPSDFAVVTSNPQDGFRREKALAVKDSQGNQLHLKLHYLYVCNLKHHVLSTNTRLETSQIAAAPSK